MFSGQLIKLANLCVFRRLRKQMAKIEKGLYFKMGEKEGEDGRKRKGGIGNEKNEYGGTQLEYWGKRPVSWT